MSELEANPFHSYRHTVSVAGMPIFVVFLLLILSLLQPVRTGQMVGIWVWCVLGIVVLFALLWLIGRSLVRWQGVRGNPHCSTPQGRRYMLFIFISSLGGVLGVAGLVVCVLKGWIRMNISVLLPGMLASLTLALVFSGLLWHTFGLSGRKSR